MTILEKFAYFLYNCDSIEMNKVFGESMGEHLWSKLTGVYNKDWGRWLCSLDNTRIQILQDYIEQKEIIR